MERRLSLTSKILRSRWIHLHQNWKRAIPGCETKPFRVWESSSRRDWSNRINLLLFSKPLSNRFPSPKQPFWLKQIRWYCQRENQTTTLRMPMALHSYLVGRGRPPPDSEGNCRLGPITTSTISKSKRVSTVNTSSQILASGSTWAWRATTSIILTKWLLTRVISSLSLGNLDRISRNSKIRIK